MTWGSRVAAISLGLWLGVAGLAEAQAAATPQVPEDLEPRTIGTIGTNIVGFGGYLDRTYSSERLLPTNYTLEIDISRFVRRKLVLRGGLSGSGSYGGDDAEDRPVGVGVSALHARFAALYYFTPQAIWSLYTGAEYWTQLTQREGTDRGSILGNLGVQGAISSRTSLFMEGGYGLGLTGNDEATNRLTARVGLRVKF